MSSKLDKRLRLVSSKSTRPNDESVYRSRPPTTPTRSCGVRPKPSTAYGPARIWSVWSRHSRQREKNIALAIESANRGCRSVKNAGALARNTARRHCRLDSFREKFGLWPDPSGGLEHDHKQIPIENCM